MNILRNPSLRVSILIRVFPIAIVLLGFVSYYVVRNVSFEIRNQIQQQVNHRAENVRTAVQSKLRHAKDACAAIANNDIVINSIVDLEHRKSVLQPFIQSLDFPDMPVFDIAMLSYDGEPIAKKTTQSLDAERIVEWLNTRSESPFIELTERELVVAHPVRYGASIEGALVTVHDAHKLFSDVTLGNESMAIRLSFRDATLSRSDNAAALASGNWAKPEGWFASKFQVTELPGLAGEVWYGNATATEATNAVGHALILAVLGISAVLLAGLLWAAGFTARQLNDLLEAINVIRSNGDRSCRMSIGGIAEFRRLQTQFNGMMADLEKTTVSTETYRIPALVARYTDNLVVVTDAKGRIEWVNEAFVRGSGYTLAEALGKTPGSLLQGPDSDPDAVTQMRQALALKKGFDVEIINYSKAGEPYLVSIESRPIYDDEGEVINFIAIESDVTDKRRAQEEKQALSKELIELSRQAGKAEMATGVLHNVGNVLNSINVSTNLMSSMWRDSRITTLHRVAETIDQHKDNMHEFLDTQQGKLLPEMLRGLSDAIDKERDRHQQELTAMAKCVEHVKEIVRNQQQNARSFSAYETISPIELVEEALRYDQTQLEANNICVQREFGKTPDLLIDRHRVLQILVNLTRNARNAVIENESIDPRVEISVERDTDESILISVTDNGVGIEHQNLTKIFNHGFTTREKGHGFGLHASALAAQALGGSLSAQSDGIGRGAKFILRLPLEPPGEREEEDSGLAIATDAEAVDS